MKPITMESYTMEEVSKHNTKDDLWIVRNKIVYDITKFAKMHPGGADILIKNSGTNASETMRNPAVHKHTPTAYRLMTKYAVGRLDMECNGATGIANGVHIHDEDRDEDFLQDWALDDMIDWSQPLLWQVGKLGSKYMEWVHTPVERHVRLFKSDICEFFSECPWYTVPIIWLPFISYMLYNALQAVGDGIRVFKLTNEEDAGFELRLVHLIPLFIFGMITWSLLEYSIHRFLFHANPPADWPSLITLHFLMHGQHHKDPLNRLRLVFPPVPASSLAGPLIVFFYFLLPNGVNNIIIAGAVCGYVMYDMTHYYVHHGEPSLGYFKELKTYHIRHHFENVNLGFGISSKLWDYPFGTVFPSKKDT